MRTSGSQHPPNLGGSRADRAICVDPGVGALKRMSQRCPLQTNAGFDIELCAVGVAHDSSAVAIQKFVLSPRERRTLVRAAIPINANQRIAPDDEVGVAAESQRVQPEGVHLVEIA